ncbi:hypothetical protein ABH931_006081 [Streptacidiphilus sp. MAP12-33]|uniref:hypothetical protein n=1 Tax=Streptacidiphilus sp. MAP12-33 TaxID=3156266 RepID=UPI003511508E
MRPRYTLRKVSRDAQRTLRRLNGPAVRYEPARNDTCPEHHRQLPCKRCTDATA